MDWSWLRDFGVVAEMGSLSEAARALGVSQPTLTRRMAALEGHLGVEVLHRGLPRVVHHRIGIGRFQEIAHGGVDQTGTADQEVRRPHQSRLTAAHGSALPAMAW